MLLLAIQEACHCLSYQIKLRMKNLKISPFVSLIINSNPGGYIKKDIDGQQQVHIDFCF
jgi:hypothetical protein